MAEMSFRPAHGGALIAAAKHYDIPLEHWLDLSTGINPHPFPLPAMPRDLGERLPEISDNLTQLVEHYYGSHPWVIANGSQAIIQNIPFVLGGIINRSESLRIGLVSPAYSEHERSWEAYSAALTRLNSSQQLLDPARIRQCDVLVLVNPNNPTGEQLPLLDLQQLLEQCQAQNTWLIIDEAFMDTQSVASALNLHHLDQCLVLRSLGKFFGLPGWRVGFAFGDGRLVNALKKALGPWPVASPSLWVTEQCLANQSWQRDARKRLQRDCQALSKLVSAFSNKLGVQTIAASDFFVTSWFASIQQAQSFYDFAARQGILVRHFDDTAMIRFGLPRHNSDWQRLEQLIQDYCR